MKWFSREMYKIEMKWFGVNSYSEKRARENTIPKEKCWFHCQWKVTKLNTSNTLNYRKLGWMWTSRMFMITFCRNNLFIKQSMFFSKAVQINTKFILTFLFINDCIEIHCYWKIINRIARIFIVVRIQSKTDWFFCSQ